MGLNVVLPAPTPLESVILPSVMPGLLLLTSVSAFTFTISFMPTLSVPSVWLIPAVPVFTPETTFTVLLLPTFRL